MLPTTPRSLPITTAPLPGDQPSDNPAQIGSPATACQFRRHDLPSIVDMELLLSVTVFLAFGAVFVLANLILGAFARPHVPNPEKATVYECGEPVIGSSWVQFDLRFYIVALVYLIFDVEVALFYPWAVAYGSAPSMAQSLGMTTAALRGVAIVDMLFFFGVLMVGFAYLWRFGYLDWVRSAATTSLKVDYQPGVDLRREARLDRAAS
jgi:NADH-quinone oxidoreductase subunit A